jgi:hypothetical protein
MRPSRLRRLLAHLTDLATLGGQIVRTLSAPFHFSHCASSAPCSCNWPTGLLATYTVSGWGGLATCSQCDSSSDPAWSGTLNHVGSGCIWWAANATFDSLSINGSLLDITYTQVLLRTTTTPCRWELYIACASLTNPTQTMWAGYKIGGSTPVGTYSFVSSDCGNTTATMTIA